MISLWWSFALTTIGVVGLALVYRRSTSIIGPGIGLGVQLLWVAYSVATGQWWFLLSAFTYGAVNIYGLRTRLAQRKPRPAVAAGVGGWPVDLAELREIVAKTADWPGDSEVDMSESQARLIVRHPQGGSRG